MVAFFFQVFRLATAFQGHFPKNFPLSLVIQLLLQPFGCVCVYGLWPFQNRRGLFFWWQFVQKQQNSNSKCAARIRNGYYTKCYFTKLQTVPTFDQIALETCLICLLHTSFLQMKTKQLCNFEAPKASLFSFFLFIFFIV